MSQPYTCPTCAGTKKVSRPPWIPGDVRSWAGAGLELYDCPTCNATGIVWDRGTVTVRVVPDPNEPGATDGSSDWRFVGSDRVTYPSLP